jgi:hypothetical protein
MRKVDAPRAGWYPDPTSRTSLRWWDGLDWTDMRRSPPSGAELIAAEENRAFYERQAVRTSPLPPMAEGMSRSDVDQIVAEVRHAARSELDRASQEFSHRATTAFRSVGPLVSEYTNNLKKWARRAVVVAVVVFVGYLLVQFLAQASFFDWLGDRIDNIEFESSRPASSPDP